jgi:hypothetical protein
MTISINDLLHALQNPDKVVALENTKETWTRIGIKDSFEELGLEPSELDAFLSEWLGENPYENV